MDGERAVAGDDVETSSYHVKDALDANFTYNHSKPSSKVSVRGPDSVSNVSSSRGRLDNGSRLRRQFHEPDIGQRMFSYTLITQIVRFTTLVCVQHVMLSFFVLLSLFFSHTHTHTHTHTRTHTALDGSGWHQPVGRDAMQEPDSRPDSGEIDIMPAQIRMDSGSTHSLGSQSQGSISSGQRPPYQPGRFN